MRVVLARPWRVSKADFYLSGGGEWVGGGVGTHYRWPKEGEH